MAGRRRVRRRRAPADVRVPGVARIDVGRSIRTGAPEIILAEGKATDHLVRIVAGLRAAGVGALVSRPSPVQRRALTAEARRGGWRWTVLAGGRILRLPGPIPRAAAPGPVALVTAGTADIPIAEEARAVLGALGVRTVSAYDVGVAGLHRLLAAVARLERRRPVVYLAFAGREGALPTVLAGLVGAPVLGVPTSVGYGRGGRGEAALTAMLQSCAPVAVTNIDAGVPAALFALQLLAGAHRARPPRGGVPF